MLLLRVGQRFGCGLGGDGTLLGTGERGPMELISIGVNWPMAQLVAYRNTMQIPVARPRR